MLNIMVYVWVMTLMGWITMEVLHHKERKDLYDRLMSANYTDYVQSHSPPPRPRENPLKKAINGAYQNQKKLDEEDF